MDPSLFDAPSADERCQAIDVMLADCSPAAVLAFCRRWNSPHRNCADTAFDVDKDGDDVRMRSMAAYDRLQDAFTAGMRKLRALEEGVFGCLHGLQDKAYDTQRGLEICLKTADPGFVDKGLARLEQADAARALAAATHLASFLSDDDPRRAAAAALLARQAPEAPATVAKPKKKAKGGGSVSAQIKALRAADGSSQDKAQAKALLERASVKGAARAKLLYRVAEWTSAPTDRLDHLEAAWQALPKKNAKDPGHAIHRDGLRLAIGAGSKDLVVRWFQRMAEHLPAYFRRSAIEDGAMTPWILEPGIREHAEPKLAAGVRAIHAELQRELLVTLSLRNGRSTSDKQERVSQIGGRPFLPASEPWPVDRNGVPMSFLAQLDFEQLPTLPGFPIRGLLLLFVPNDNSIGMRFDVGVAGEYGAVFIEDPKAIDALVDCYPHERRCLAEGYLDKALVAKPSVLSWGVELQPPVPSDRRFFDRIAGAADVKKSALASHQKKWSNAGIAGGHHRLGGYAFFVQGEDPRRDQTADYVQLLSLDSYDPWGLMFGDGGLAHFFIDPEDLQAKRFDRMLYFWDCA